MAGTRMTSTGSCSGTTVIDLTSSSPKETVRPSSSEDDNADQRKAKDTANSPVSASRDVSRQRGPSPKGIELILYPDGSFLPSRCGGAGIAWYNNGSWHGRAVVLGQIRGSEAAEMHAIVEAFKLCAAMLKDQDIRHLVIRSDSSSSLKRLAAVFLKKRDASGDYLLSQAVAEMNKLTELELTVQLQWIKGHNQNPGNERADKLASLAASMATASREHWGKRLDNPDISRVRNEFPRREVMLAFIKAEQEAIRLQRKAERRAAKRQHRVNAFTAQT